MSYRIPGIINAVSKAPALTTGERLVGQLVHLNALGQGSLTASAIHFPITEYFNAAQGDSAFAAQMTGVAMVWVEDFTSIVPGSPLKAGATGLGADLASAGEAFFGHALAPATVNGQLIPVLLTKGNVEAA